MKKQLLVVCIIFLFVGMGFQPAFAIDNNISVGIVEQQLLRGTFMKTFGGKYDDSGRTVQQTTDGGYIITGDIMTGLLKFNRDICLIKTDEYGRSRNKAVTVNLLLQNLLERFPLLERLLILTKNTIN